MDERWKDIDGYMGMYQISNLGRVRSFYNKRHGVRDTATIRKNQVNVLNGYIYVKLVKQDGYKMEKIHRLVADAFLPKIEGFNEVDHIDKDITNNTVSNLRWVDKHLNQLNRKVNDNNKTGCKGISFREGRSLCWIASWKEDKKQKSKGFESKEEAIQFRKIMTDKFYSKEHYSD